MHTTADDPTENIGFAPPRRYALVVRALALLALLAASLGCGSSRQPGERTPPAADDAAVAARPLRDAAVAVARADEAVGTEITLRVLGMT